MPRSAVLCQSIHSAPSKLRTGRPGRVAVNCLGNALGRHPTAAAGVASLLGQAHRLLPCCSACSAKVAEPDRTSADRRA